MVDGKTLIYILDKRANLQVGVLPGLNFGGRQDAYLYFGQAGEFAGENSTRIELWWAATAQAYLNFGQVECCPCSQTPGSEYQWRWKG